MLVGLTAPGIVGYCLSDFSLKKGGYQTILKTNENQYWVVALYKDYYIVSEINTSNNTVKKEYGLIPIEPKEDQTVLIMREKLKINFGD